MHATSRPTSTRYGELVTVEASARGEIRVERQYPLASWFAVLAGPLAWATDDAVALTLTRRVCATHGAGLLLVSSAVALAVAATGLVVAVRLAKQDRQRSGQNGVSMQRTDLGRFVTLSGIAASGGFMLVIVAAALPRLLIDPCI